MCLSYLLWFINISAIHSTIHRIKQYNTLWYIDTTWLAVHGGQKQFLSYITTAVAPVATVVCRIHGFLAVFVQRLVVNTSQGPQQAVASSSPLFHISFLTFYPLLSLVLTRGNLPNPKFLKYSFFLLRGVPIYSPLNFPDAFAEILATEGHTNAHTESEFQPAL